jgi:hypothetical protein
MYIKYDQLVDKYISMGYDTGLSERLAIREWEEVKNVSLGKRDYQRRLFRETLQKASRRRAVG